jgi:hypothetical protein
MTRARDSSESIGRALVVAPGGTSYATLAPGSVDTKQLKNSAVTTSKLHNGAVGAAKLKNGAVTTSKLGNGAVTAAKIANGSITGTALDPAATTADNATNATNATTATNAIAVGGRQITTFEKLVATGTTTPQTVVVFGGLTITLSCDASRQPTVAAAGTVNGSMIRGVLVPGNGGTPNPFVGISSITANSPLPLVNAVDGGLVFEYAQPDGHLVSISSYVDNTTTINDFDGCSMSGSAISG